jgi:hypothetical protein
VRALSSKAFVGWHVKQLVSVVLVAESFQAAIFFSA